MARMHSRIKGKSGSTKPSEKKIPVWVIHKPQEVEMLIAKLRKEDLAPSKIGIMLRDNYGIPDVKLITGKSITQILKEKNISTDLPEDLTSLIKKAVMLRKHLELNAKDMPGKRGLQLTESKIKRLVKYYIKAGKLPATWKYDHRNASRLID